MPDKGLLFSCAVILAAAVLGTILLILFLRKDPDRLPGISQSAGKQPTEELPERNEILEAMGFRVEEDITFYEAEEFPGEGKKQD